MELARPVANKFWNPESLLRHLLFGKIRIRKSCCTKNFWKGFWNPWTRCQRSANQPLEACRIMHPTATLNSQQVSTKFQVSLYVLSAWPDSALGLIGSLCIGHSEPGMKPRIKSLDIPYPHTFSAQLPLKHVHHVYCAMLCHCAAASMPQFLALIVSKI